MKLIINLKVNAYKPSHQKYKYHKDKKKVKLSLSLEGHRVVRSRGSHIF
jgi:hypothetical protein